MYFVFIVCLCLAILYFYNKKYFLAIIKDIRPFRLLYYVLLFIWGIVFGNNYYNTHLDKYLGLTFDLNSFIPFPLISVIIIIVLAWLLSVIINNIEDQKIDAISSPWRPLVSGSISLAFYKKITLILIILIFLGSVAIGFNVFYMILLFIGNYFLYSSAPFKLKRIPLLSKLIISANSLILIFSGFIIGYVYQSGVNIYIILNNFPGSLIIYILVFFTLAINFIDIKDYYGDKAVGIKTLPVIFGLEISKLIIGMFVFIAYAVSPLFINMSFWLVLLLYIFGIIQFVLINKKEYSESPVFVIILISLLTVIICNQ